MMRFFLLTFCFFGLAYGAVQVNIEKEELNVSVISLLNQDVREIKIKKWTKIGPDKKIPENFKLKYLEIIQTPLACKIQKYTDLFKTTEDGLVFELMLKDKSINTLLSDNLKHLLRFWCGCEKTIYDNLKKQFELCPDYLKETLSSEGLWGQIDPNIRNIQIQTPNENFFYVSIFNLLNFGFTGKIENIDLFSSFFSSIYNKLFLLKTRDPLHSRLHLLIGREYLSYLRHDIETGNELKNQDKILKSIYYLTQHIQMPEEGSSRLISLLFLSNLILNMDPSEKLPFNSFSNISKIVRLKICDNEIDNRINLIKSIHASFNIEDKNILRVVFDSPKNQNDANIVCNLFSKKQYNLIFFNSIYNIRYILLYLSEWIVNGQANGATLWAP